MCEAAGAMPVKELKQKSKEMEEDFDSLSCLARSKAEADFWKDARDSGSCFWILRTRSTDQALR